jgi:hypothetical protein
MIDFEEEKSGTCDLQDKILAIDPLSEDSVVTTGSRNLAYKASCENDGKFTNIYTLR